MTVLSNSDLLCLMQMPLPGVVIFVHGVNSEGEWFEASEEGLCAGLNRRLGRMDEQLSFSGKAAGQMAPMKYIDSLTEDGYINPLMTSRTYLQPKGNTYSPVIHFRWGYKASKKELKRYGDKIFLNEKNYWGGGPFANGCGSLPDLWNQGVDPRIFGFLNVQGVNPTTRPIYETPPRAYNVLGALRLAKLIKSIRKMQADVPITVVCHSQGNMVGIAAAFLGDRLSKEAGVRCVADTYVLANPPYSLLGTLKKYDNSPFMEQWTQREAKDSQGNRGRVDSLARAKTLKKFFELIAQGKDREDQRDAIEYSTIMANHKKVEDNQSAYDPDVDRRERGVKNHTYGRVTLYSCPHDQVISAAPVQGMGWRGLHPDEVAIVKGESLFTQRVFATNFWVGTKEPSTYHTRENDWRFGKGSNKLFFFPESPPARFNLVKNLRGNEHWYGKVGTIATAPLFYLVTLATSTAGAMRANADPPKDWKVLCDAPGLPQPFLPQAMRYGEVVHVEDGSAVSNFNEDNDPPAAQRNRSKASAKADDPYDNYEATKQVSDKKLAGQMAPKGDVKTEAAQRYEDHAIVRMEARHNNNPDWVKGDVVVGETGSDAELPDGYKEWRNKEIVHILDASVNNPTNHSTIMTNEMHARMALSYDVAIGINRLSSDQMDDFRIEADWRFGESLSEYNPNSIYSEYFLKGSMGNQFLHSWIMKNSDAKMPAEIDETRQGGGYLAVGEAI
ncbi:hypothetical protein GR157_09805 [Burkholderia sp. 4701]|nr:hypothetical protein [Burkholderia sp. 4701]MXN82348.1 hypothetical protein [Burkholderia sp. 4812]